jgi:hypothetical protein
MNQTGSISFNQASSAEQTLYELTISAQTRIRAIWVDATNLDTDTYVDVLIYKKINGTYRLAEQYTSSLTSSDFSTGGLRNALANDLHYTGQYHGPIDSCADVKIVLQGNGLGTGSKTIYYEIDYELTEAIKTNLVQINSQNVSGSVIDANLVSIEDDTDKVMDLGTMIKSTRGPELFQNNGFDDGSWWTLGGSASIADGVGKLTSASDFIYHTYEPLEAGDYEMVFTILTNNVRVYGGGASEYDETLPPGTYRTDPITFGNQNIQVGFQGTNAGASQVDNVKFRKILADNGQAYIVPGQEVDMVSIDGNATSGNNAILNLKQLNIVNNAGSAIIASSTGSNGDGIRATGNGTGDGVHAGSGGGATGDGIHALSNATNGNGIKANGGTSGNGINATGGAGAGSGIKAIGAPGGAANGIEAVAQTNGGAGVYASGSGTGHGITALKGGGVGAKDIDSDQTDAIGSPVALDGGNATLAGMLTKMADDNGGADFDAATDSQTEIAASVASIEITGPIDANLISINDDEVKVLDFATMILSSRGGSLISNGEFDSSSGWNLLGSASISGGKGHFTTASDQINRNTNAAATVGDYDFEFEVFTNPLIVTLQSDYEIPVENITYQPGKHRVSISVSTQGIFTVIFMSTDDITAEIDNVSLKKIISATGKAIIDQTGLSLSAGEKGTDAIYDNTVNIKDQTDIMMFDESDNILANAVVGGGGGEITDAINKEVLTRTALGNPATYRVGTGEDQKTVLVTYTTVNGVEKVLKEEILP